MENKVDFEDFCNYVAEHVKEHLPEQCRDMDIRLVDGEDLGSSDDRKGIILIGDTNSAPVIYLNAVYNDYRRYGAYSMTMAVQNIASIYMNTIEEIHSMQIPDPGGLFQHPDKHRNWEEIKDKVKIRAVPVTGNEETLKSVPCRIQGDIACIYKVYLKEKVSMVINDVIMGRLGISGEELHNAAVNNSVRYEPAEFMSMEEMMKTLLDIPGDMIPSQEECRLYVLSNQNESGGAAVIFYPGMLDMVADQFPEGFYILPSSQHEVIICKMETGTKEEIDELNQMVWEINRSQVDPVDRLSDKVHAYDPVTKQIYIAGEEIPVIERSQKETIKLN